MLTGEIADFLQDRGYGLLGTNILYSMPTSPDDVIVITQTPGDTPITVKGKVGPVLDRPRFQITVRALVPSTAELIAYSIYKDLTRFRGEINGIAYSNVIPLQEPFWLRRDESRRTEYTNTYQAWKQPSPT
jgi:Bacteriophage minor capsid protein